MAATCKSLNKPEHGDIGNEMVSISVGLGVEQANVEIHKGLLVKATHYFDEQLATGEGKLGKVVLDKEYPAVVKMLHDWLYTGHIDKAPTKLRVKKMDKPLAQLRPEDLPSAEEMERLGKDLHSRFKAAQETLVRLHILAEKLDINDLQNKVIDTIQDGFHEYGTVFECGLIMIIFKESKKGSQLRELCVAANVIHMDRGCGELREDLRIAGLFFPEFTTHMLTWISRNFGMFARRRQEGYSTLNHTKGFSMLNRSKLCPCHFHKHGPGEAHEGHKKCSIPYGICDHSTCSYEDCGHKKEEEGGSANSVSLGSLSIYR